MLRLNKSDRLETIEKHFHLKGYDTMNNPGRNSVSLKENLSDYCKHTNEKF